MGLGIYVGAKIPRKGFLKRAVCCEDLFDLIENTALQFLHSKTLKHSYLSRDEQVLYLSFHPSEEDVYFYCRDDNHIVCSAKTSSAGHREWAISTFQTIQYETQQ